MSLLYHVELFFLRILCIFNTHGNKEECLKKTNSSVYIIM